MLERGTGVAIPEATALYHQHPAQVSANRLAMQSAQQSVIESYADRPWCTRAVLQRHEGRVAWDAARASIAEGAPVVPTVLRLVRRLLVPQRALGVGQLLVGRLWGRRLASRHATGGEPSVAILPGAVATPGVVAADLRNHSLPVALARLAMRPTALALVGSPAAAVLTKLLGVQPVSAPPARAGTGR
jgi:hypothetical protein